jgi:ubiquinone/menaquinone biosynthesis C-methylase UbiE
MEIKRSDPSLQYGNMENFRRREESWAKYGIGTGKYGIAFIDFKGDELVLDAGSGTGSDVIAISRCLNKGGKIFALDISQELLRMTQQRAGNVGASPLCVIASVQDLPFAQGQFDVVIAKHVLNHLDDLDRGLSELMQVVKKGGVVVITTGVETPDDDFLRVVHQGAIARVGISSNVRLSRSPFHCGNAMEYLDRFFGQVKYHFYKFEMVFPGVQDFMSYYTTLPCFQEATEDEDLKLALATAVKGIVDDREKPITLDRSRGTFLCRKI